MNYPKIYLKCILLHGSGDIIRHNELGIIYLPRNVYVLIQVLLFCTQALLADQKC